MRYVEYRVVTPATGDIVTVEEFIDHARLNGLTVDRQPELIARELDAATGRAEAFLRRSLLTQTLEAYYVPNGLDCRCSLEMRLPRGRVQSVTSVTGADGVLVPAGTYRLEWVTVIVDEPLRQAASVVYVSGYGDAAEDVPAPIREGILQYAATLYDDRLGARESKDRTTAGATVPPGVRDLWRPYQIEVSG